MGVLKKLPFVLLGATLFAAQPQTAPPPAASKLGNLPAERVALPIPAELARLLNVSRLKLTDGRTLRDVTVVAVDGDGISLHSREGNVTVAYALFPIELQPALNQLRPVKQTTVIVKGGVLTNVAPELPSGKLTDPLPVLKHLYPGRVRVTGPDGKPKPLASAIVMAVLPSDYAAFNLARLKKHGAEIDAAHEKALAAVAAGQHDATLRPAALAAVNDWRLAIYTSLDPLPKAIATTDTDPNGSFTLVCYEPDIVLVARGTLAAGEDFEFYTWVAGAGSGGKAELTTENQLTR